MTPADVPEDERRRAVVVAAARDVVRDAADAGVVVRARREGDVRARARVEEQVRASGSDDDRRVERDLDLSAKQNIPRTRSHHMVHR